MAKHLSRVVFSATHLRHHRTGFVSGLILKLRIIHRTSVDTGGVPVFRRPTRNGRALSRSANAFAGASPARPPALFVSDVDFSTQKRSGGQHHRTSRFEDQSHLGFTRQLLCPLQPLNPRQIAETDSSWVDVPKYPERHSYKALGLLAP